MRPALLSMSIAALAFAASGGAAHAREPEPEITRPAATPQSVGTVHTVRGIPEACTRLEGVFTGEAAQPYRMSVVRTSPNCRARARFVEFAQANPSQASGWTFNDRVRIPNAACPGQQAVVNVWRKAGAGEPPELDAQGRSRIYLQDAAEQARRRAAPDLPMYSAELRVEGKACN